MTTRLPTLFGIARFVSRLFLVLTAFAAGARAQTNSSWLLVDPDGDSGNWSTASRWTNGVPNGNVDAIINTFNTATVTLDVNANIHSLFLGPGVEQTDILQMSPGVTLNASGSIFNGGRMFLNMNDTVNVAGSIVNSACSAGCAVQIFGNGSTLNVGSSVSFGSDGFNFGFTGSKVAIGGDFSSGATEVSLVGSTMTVAGNYTQNNESSMFLDSHSSLVVGKDLNLVAASSSNLQGTTTVFGNLNINNGEGGPNQIANLTTFSGFYQSGQSVTTVNGVLSAFGASLNLAGGTLTNSGVINGNLAMQGGSYNGTGVLNGNASVSGGTFSGTGTVNGNLTVAGATLAPGDAPGTITINGDYRQLSNGAFLEEANWNNGFNASLLRVNGTAYLDGTLDLDLHDDGQPIVGDSFTLMTFWSEFGTFDTITGVNLGDNLFLDVIYDAHDIRVDVESLPTATPEPNLSLISLIGCFAALYTWKRS